MGIEIRLAFAKDDEASKFDVGFAMKVLEVAEGNGVALGDCEDADGVVSIGLRPSCRFIAFFLLSLFEEAHL